ncbi:CRIB domain profile [Nakaseomyces glabratus]
MASIQGNQMLPQIKSIWIDEDQEAEKLYGMAGQTLLLDESDMESDNEEFDVTVLNSDKPVLNHKKKIMLPPLVPRSPTYHRYNKIASPDAGKKDKKFFRSLFKSNGSKNKGSNGDKAMKISTPFDFHHISHASFNRNQSTDLPNLEDIENYYGSEQLSQLAASRAIGLNKAFVTKSTATKAPSNFSSLTKSQGYGNLALKKDRVVSSSSISLARSGSVASSNLSNNNSLMKNGRVVSSSTIATSLFDYEDHLSPNHSVGMKPTFASHTTPNFENKENRDSGNSELSINFLKSYSFPTLLEEEEEDAAFEVNKASEDKLVGNVLESLMDSCDSLESKNDPQTVHHDIDELESGIKRLSFENTPKKILTRRNSDTQVFKNFGESPLIHHSPKNMKSADDLLTMLDNQINQAYSEDYF